MKMQSFSILSIQIRGNSSKALILCRKLHCITSLSVAKWDMVNKKNLEYIRYVQQYSVYE